MTRTEILQIARPILFSTPMVQAIMDGRKTKFLREIYHQFEDSNFDYYERENVVNEKVVVDLGINSYSTDEFWHKPEYKPGDYLNVKEILIAPINKQKAPLRILLKVLDVRAKQLRYLSMEDFKCEDLPQSIKPMKVSYYDTNPFVWVYEFELVTPDA